MSKKISPDISNKIYDFNQIEKSYKSYEKEQLDIVQELEEDKIKFANFIEETGNDVFSDMENLRRLNEEKKKILIDKILKKKANTYSIEELFNMELFEVEKIYNKLNDPKNSFWGKLISGLGI